MGGWPDFVRTNPIRGDRKPLHQTPRLVTLMLHHSYSAKNVERAEQCWHAEIWTTSGAQWHYIGKRPGNVLMGMFETMFLSAGYFLRVTSRAIYVLYAKEATSAVVDVFSFSCSDYSATFSAVKGLEALGWARTSYSILRRNTGCHLGDRTAEVLSQHGYSGRLRFF